MTATMASGRTLRREFTRFEDDDRRVLGAVRFVNDVDGTPIQAPLEIIAAPPPPGQAPDPASALPVRVLRNRYGLQVIQAARGFEDYMAQFEPPPSEPARESRFARLRVVDPSGQFLPADFIVRLPRSHRPQDPNHPTVFDPVVVRLLPAPAGPEDPGWTILRALVWRLVAAPTAANPNATRAEPLPGALVRVLRAADNLRLGRGLTEWRPRRGAPSAAAEALVAVWGLPVTNWTDTADAAVLSGRHAVTIEARFDPAFDPARAGTVPDADVLETGGGGIVARALPAPISLTARARATLHLTFDPDLQLAQAQPIQT